MRAIMLDVFIFFTVFIIFSTSSAFATCTVNEDWLEAPCFDTMPVNRDEYRNAWAPYYDHKGSEGMEVKKAELLQAINDGTFMEWKGNAENSNVYQYYHSIGLVPNQYKFFSFEDESPHRQYVEPNLELLFVLIGTALGLAVSTVFISRRKRKSKMLFRINLGIVIFLGVGWLYFYWFILTDDITKMMHAMTANYSIFGLNLIFASSLILLPISYMNRK